MLLTVRLGLLSLITRHCCRPSLGLLSGVGVSKPCMYDNQTLSCTQFCNPIQVVHSPVPDSSTCLAITLGASTL
jgi:hypothetical protein